MKATRTQLAAYVGKSERTIIRWLASGKWPHTQLPGGLIEIDDSLLNPPEEQEEGTILATLARLEKKIDDLAVCVRQAPAQKGEQASKPPYRVHTEGRHGYTILEEGNISPDKKGEAAQQPQKSTMPEGLVGWRAFARIHNVSPGTVQKGIESGRLTIVEPKKGDVWIVGRATVLGALDATGRARFYELWHNSGKWKDCPDCPHE